MSKSLVAILTAVSLVACSPERIDADLLKIIEAKTLMPSCAQRAVVTVEKGYDGLNGRDLAAHFRIDDRCKSAWWRILDSSDEYECEVAQHHRSCDLGKLGDSLFGRNGGIMVMPRDNDMLVLKTSKPRIPEQ